MSCDWSSAAAVTPDGQTIVFAAHSRLGFAVGNPPVKRHVATGLSPITDLAITPDGRTAVVVGKPGKENAPVQLWDIAGRTRRSAFNFDVGAVYAVAVTKRRPVRRSRG